MVEDNTSTTMCPEEEVMMIFNSTPAMTPAAMAAAHFSCRRAASQTHTAVICLDAAVAASIFVVLTVVVVVVCLSVSVMITLVSLITLISLLVLHSCVRLRSEYRD